MGCYYKRLFGFFLLLTFLWTDTSSARDTVYLKSGRILRGTVKEGKAEKSGDFILLTTESGSVYKLDKSDIVKSIIKREKVDDQYEARLRHVRNIATDHIELVDWCEDQERGRVRFKEQIRWHYENVVRLDPDHKKARKALKHMKLPNGTWVAEAEFKARQGYVKDRRRGYLAGLINDVNAGDEAYDAKAGARKKEFNLWVKAANRGRLQPGVLADICDESSVFMVYESALTVADNLELVRVHLDAISTVKSNAAIRMIAHFAMMAPKRDVREHAISLLSQPEIDNATAVLTLAEGLKYDNQGIIHASAAAIAEVASSDQYSRDLVCVALADSLRTTHDVKIPGALEAGRMQPSFGSGGTGFRMGGGPQTRKEEFTNQPSLDALRRLFEADFGFNEQAWKNWYIENYTLYDQKVRGTAR